MKEGRQGDNKQKIPDALSGLKKTQALGNTGFYQSVRRESGEEEDQAGEEERASLQTSELGLGLSDEDKRMAMTTTAVTDVVWQGLS